MLGMIDIRYWKNLISNEILWSIATREMWKLQKDFSESVTISIFDSVES
ncbi:MAG: hypothetical protein ACD_3C00191G0001 [uncultured bacterium (gcode 4)]|uniref:Uncharacterized protein n=1 Tax=uncultured bacterium (gcode 4) TaxID=1234023 RepID=K2GW55_9BACT|nr:MAG: hypothetical protein ACD_3C00191G0001 [uncultured bacterium (gcode 4)]